MSDNDKIRRLAAGLEQVTKTSFTAAESDVAAFAPTALPGTLTATAPGTPDYALQDVTNSSPYGFADAEEARSFIDCVLNLQTRTGETETAIDGLVTLVNNLNARVGELETMLQDLGIAA